MKPARIKIHRSKIVSETLIHRIVLRRKLPEKEVRGMLSHNIMTVRQLQTVTGYSWNKIKGLTALRRSPKQPQLRSVRPFSCPRSKVGPKVDGPEFILVDGECVKCIEESLENPRT